MTLMIQQADPYYDDGASTGTDGEAKDGGKQ